MGQVKDWMAAIIHSMPEAASFEDIVRELVLRRQAEERHPVKPTATEPKPGWHLPGGIRPWQRKEKGEG